MKNVLLTIAYDGTDFCGWQKQPDQRSVQGEVERALSIVCAKPIRINGTSRTDAGVHAYGQRASFLAEFSIPTEKIPMVANGIFASAVSEKSRKASGDVAILTAEEMPVDFHARFDTIGKKYIYKINNSQKPDPFQRNYCYQIARVLDIDAMKQAAIHLIGTKDFKCFQAAGGKELESTVRTIHSARLVALENKDIGFEIIGDGFLYNMVRIIAGTLVDVGLGRKTPDELPDIIKNKNRQLAGHTAPPQGLYLAEVFYEEKKLREAMA
ncbi:MAG TPA: tRNA pseudouridine(38-40) synthase TruA [Anaerovoracaceae bacterium]|nr:tRNA pseudouridine(38-40) synthase TruA [Anaerovoracaceae bacterium]